MKPSKTIQDFCKNSDLQRASVSVVNLGCARNLVDSQIILGQLRHNGHHIVDMDSSDVAIVNTCGFIEDAKKESLDVIVDLLKLKKQGKLKKVIVAGCLAQRYGSQLAEEFKDIDAIIGVQRLQSHGVPDQELLTPSHFAYVKICESCYNQCSFCIIPKIKGKFISRTMESVLDEIKQLDARGVKEIHMIGQDITAYGMDIYRKNSLAALLKRVIAVTDNIQWIRLLYTYPAHITDELIEVIAREEKICNYIDMPLQHINDRLLKAMNRKITRQQTIDLVKKVRGLIPRVCIRTAFIVGMPTESQDDFEELLQFVRDMRFEKVGGFVYSREEGTLAYDMPHQVPESVKKERLDSLMTVQQDISRSLQERHIGETLKVIIDEEQKDEKNIYLGRSEYDAPEVDGLVYVHSKRKLAAGDFVMVKVRDATEYDLVGDVI
ncbi:MAG: 30S ribosomal protein S12 methylthiotransferase RimO [Candidatus Omnitrophica bacterium]|nr:30S ribosomal protein S12 methylthiotransferase RimO [Candidatus Omnitrophota bacterium]